jgi:sn-glycerol 3-phosphate transport system ATP-binding protein
VAVPDGAFCVRVGPSGCGKSTLLRMIAGIETITSGTIQIGSHIVNDIEPAHRDIAMVFQNYALYPHMNVYNNMAYGLRNRGTPKAEIDARVREAAQILEIGMLLNRKPRELSGGQRQRVAMGRAIVRKPKAFLFDEPLSNLDAKLRVSMRVEIKKLQRSLATTSVYVTHDQLEAMTLGDMLVVMNAGRVEQIGAPLAVYERPATTFVASFIGAPPMNLMTITPALTAAWSDDARIALPAEGGIVGVRPENLTLQPTDAQPAGSVTFDMTVGAIERVGPETFIYGTLSAGGEMIVRLPGQAAPAPGERVRAVAPQDRLHLYSADGSRRLLA